MQNVMAAVHFVPFFRKAVSDQSDVAAMAEPKTFSILVVEDNTAIRAAIARSLERRGCSVTTATNGLEGLEAVRARGFDVVITDLSMPERGGLWLWEHSLQIRPELKGRFVLVSSESRPGGQGMGLFLASEHFFVKPFSLDDLLDQVEAIARRAGGGFRVGDSLGPDAAGRDDVFPQVSDEV
jgi:CheY-like chemotaxis protein